MAFSSASIFHLVQYPDLKVKQEAGKLGTMLGRNVFNNERLVWDTVRPGERETKPIECCER